MLSAAADDGGDFTSVTRKKSSKRKLINSHDSENRKDSESTKKAAVSVMQPVILASDNDKPLASYSPIEIDCGLRKAVGKYESCKPLRNGNLLVKCESVNQVNTLLALTELTNQSGKPIAIRASALPHPDSKCIIRNVPLQIHETEIRNCLLLLNIKFVKRFMFKNLNGEMIPGKTVLLHFDNCLAPKEVQIGYLNFKTELYIPRPLRCFNCNRFGHTSTHCKSQVRCTTCGAAHDTKTCEKTVIKCSNCGGDHSAASTKCPRYIKEAEIIKIKTVKNISYVEACKLTNNQKPPSRTVHQNLLDLEHFPKLPESNSSSPVATRQPPAVAHTNAESVDVDVQQMDNIDFTSNFMFGNPIYFVAFLAEVINTALSVKDKVENSSLNIFEVISEAAGKRMGLSVSAEQLKSLI